MINIEIDAPVSDNPAAIFAVQAAQIHDEPVLGLAHPTWAFHFGLPFAVGFGWLAISMARITAS